MAEFEHSEPDDRGTDAAGGPVGAGGEQQPGQGDEKPHQAGAGDQAKEERPARLSTGPGREQEADEQGYKDLNDALQQRVYNNFYAQVNATDAVFGFGSAGSPGLAPGYVEPAEIDRVLQHYLHPDEYDETAGQLHSKHVLVLVGEDGSGRRAGAFAMLRDLLGAEAKLRSLSPANSLADLASEGALKDGLGYVILDYAGETDDNAVQQFQIQRLQGTLRRKGSYLVLTASSAARSRLALADFCVTWRPPDPLVLFDHYTEKLGLRHTSASQQGVSAQVVEELRERVAELRRPADIAAAAKNLADGPDAALATLRDRTKQTVQDWFRTEPSAEDLLPIAALAFAERLPERTFEEVSVALGAHARDWKRSIEDTQADESAPVQQRLSVEQSRAQWQTRAVGIAEPVHCTEQGDDDCRNERRIVFTSPRVREMVIGELHALYGYGLWYPLRQWLNQLSVESSLDVRAEVARGVALLARHALSEVEEKLLRPWADGTSSQRLTAAFVLQFMCADERLAPQALNMALGWSKLGAGQSRAITAAMAFAGELGSLYRLEALNWLWVLTARGERVAAAARRSLTLFLATAEHDPERALFFLRYVRTQVANAYRTKDRARALNIVVQVLEADRLAGREPLAAFLLRSESRTASQLGSLWSTALLSVRRARAVTELCRTLAALREDRSATDSVHALGTALRDAMSARQWEGLRGDVSAALRHPDFALPGTRQLAHVLLGSMQHSNRANHPFVPGG